MTEERRHTPTRGDGGGGERRVVISFGQRRVARRRSFCGAPVKSSCPLWRVLSRDRVLVSKREVKETADSCGRRQGAGKGETDSCKAVARGRERDEVGGRRGGRGASKRSGWSTSKDGHRRTHGKPEEGHAPGMTIPPFCAQRQPGNGWRTGDESGMEVEGTAEQEASPLVGRPVEASGVLT